MSTAPVTAAIVGSGNIGSDLLQKLLRSDLIAPRYMVGVDAASEGLRRAAASGLETSAEGTDWLLAQPELPDLVFEATTAAAHRMNAPRYSAVGIKAIDLTPAAVGPYVVPAVNLEQHLDEPNLNMTSCGGQATIPIVHAVRRVVEVDYAEIVATVASKSAGPGTRANIDEFTKTTGLGLEVVGGAGTGKAIIILNPADPPIVMRDTIFCSLPPETDTEKVKQSIEQMVEDIQVYVPGYRLRSEPQFDAPSPLWNGHGRVTTFVEVEGSGDYLPAYAGNLDIMTSAATRVGEMVASHKQSVRS